MSFARTYAAKFANLNFASRKKKLGANVITRLEYPISMFHQLTARRYNGFLV